jgi:hypothetical protein
MLITDKYTLQLKQFLEIYSKYDDALMTVIYTKETDSFHVYFTLESVNSLFTLVTQKNETRTFKTMKSLIKAVPVENCEIYFV